MREFQGGGRSKNAAPQNTHIFGLYSTSKQSHIALSYLGLIIDTKGASLSVTPRNNFNAYSFAKFVNFVQSDMSEFYVCHM